MTTDLPTCAQVLREIPPAPLLRRMDQPGPRYTSYPTADRFSEAFGPAQLAHVLAERRQRDEAGGATPLSIYVHVPFCESVCYYCACNKVITKHHERAAPYLDALATELDLVTDQIGWQRSAAQIHLGGGSPTFLSDSEIAELMGALRAAFFFTEDAEISIEVDPRTASRERLRHLAAIGFNRISFGIQDFDPDVQVAVHRVQSYESVAELVAEARALRFESINADLIYGLPKQTPESFRRTIAQISELRPTRIALYAYAHLPARFKPQRRIDSQALPTPEQRIGMLRSALAGFGSNGYVYIGMDHFALPDDALAIAKRQGRLHRNFQGYTTQPDCDLISLGVSGIGRVGATYSQNAKTLDEYQDALNHDEFPIVRGLALTRDDLLRRAVIMALMCQGRVEYESIELAHLIKFKETFAPELERLAPLQEMGLCEVNGSAIQVTTLGWYFVRAVAMTFDRNLQADRVRERFSRII